MIENTFFHTYKFEDENARKNITAGGTRMALSPSFRDRCLNGLDDDSPIFFTAFSSILLDDTMFQLANEDYKDYILNENALKDIDLSSSTWSRHRLRMR